MCVHVSCFLSLFFFFTCGVSVGSIISKTTVSRIWRQFLKRVYPRTSWLFNRSEQSLSDGLIKVFIYFIFPSLLIIRQLFALFRKSSVSMEPSLFYCTELPDCAFDRWLAASHKYHCLKQDSNLFLFMPEHPENRNKDHSSKFGKYKVLLMVHNSNEHAHLEIPCTEEQCVAAHVWTFRTLDIKTRIIYNWTPKSKFGAWDFIDGTIIVMIDLHTV